MLGRSFVSDGLWADRLLVCQRPVKDTRHKHPLEFHTVDDSGGSSSGSGSGSSHHAASIKCAACHKPVAKQCYACVKCDLFVHPKCWLPEVKVVHVSVLVVRVRVRVLGRPLCTHGC